MKTVLKRQILGALCREQKDSFKDLLLNLVYRIFLFLKPSKVVSIILFPNVFIFAGIKLALFWGGLHQVQLFPVFSGWNVSWENWQWHFFPQISLPFSPWLLLLSLLPLCQDCCSHFLGRLCWGSCCFLLELPALPYLRAEPASHGGVWMIQIDSKLGFLRHFRLCCEHIFLPVFPVPA